MDDVYKQVLYVQEMCSSLQVFSKAINSDIKKYYGKDDVVALGRIDIAIDSIQSVVNNIDSALKVIKEAV